jgi:hypothetical protein
MKIVSACNKVFRKKFLQPDRIGLFPVGGGYTDNRKQSKKAIAWLSNEERKEGKRILHGRNAKQLRLPELPDIHVDGVVKVSAPSTSTTVATDTAINGCRLETYLSRVEAAPWLRDTKIP